MHAACFLAGFIVGVAAVLGSGVALADAVSLSPGSGHSAWIGVLKVALGVYLVVAALRKFLGRPRVGEECGSADPRHALPRSALARGSRG